MNKRYLYKNRKHDLANTKIKNELENESDSVIHVHQGVVLPLTNKLGGVRDANGSFIPESQYMGDWVKLGGDYTPYKINISNEQVIFLGFFLKHWGHFIIDAIGRLWILCREEYAGYKFVYLKEKAVSIDGTYEEFLNYLGIKKEQLIDIDVPTKFNNIIIPNLCTNNNYGFTNGYSQIFKRILNNVNIDDIDIPSKIYLSRTKLKGITKKEFGEKIIEDIFRDNGYEIIFPEELSLKKQIAIFQKAEEIVCVNGSIPFGIVYANSTLKLVVLNKMSLIHYNLLKLSAVAKIEPVYIDVYKEPVRCHPRYLGEGPFWIKPGYTLNLFFQDNHLIFNNKKTCEIKYYLKYYYLFFKNRGKSII